MKTIYTGIFGPYEQLKEPRVITPGWHYIAYTDQDFKSEFWQINKVAPTEFPQLKARFYKIMFHHHVETEDSIWIDGSFKINCNLTRWWDQHFKPSITCIKHPVRDCVYEEAKACIENNRAGIQHLDEQIKRYQGTIPAHNGLIQSGILMRKKNAFTENLSVRWLDEVMNYSLRDQIAFAKVSYQQPINYISWDYRTAREFIFTKHHKSKI